MSYYLQNTTAFLMTGPAAVDLQPDRQQAEGLTEFTPGMLAHPFPTPPAHDQKVHALVHGKRKNK